MNLYIGNLNYNVREGDLRGVMEEYGTVASVKLITDRETRRSKGFLKNKYQTRNGHSDKNRCPFPYS